MRGCEVAVMDLTWFITALPGSVNIDDGTGAGGSAKAEGAAAAGILHTCLGRPAGCPRSDHTTAGQDQPRFGKGC